MIPIISSSNASVHPVMYKNVQGGDARFSMWYEYFLIFLASFASIKKPDGCFPSSPYLCILLCVCVSLPVCVCVPFINVTGYLLIE